jgi:hypothetical protein
MTSYLTSNALRAGYDVIGDDSAYIVNSVVSHIYAIKQMDVVDFWTASGSVLDAMVLKRGIYRRGARAANTSICQDFSDGDVFIASDKMFVSDLGQTFVLDGGGDGGVYPRLSEVPLKCVDVGPLGNGATALKSDFWVGSKPCVASSGGADAESDVDLRGRFVEYISKVAAADTITTQGLADYTGLSLQPCTYGPGEILATEMRPTDRLGWEYSCVAKAGVGISAVKDCPFHGVVSLAPTYPDPVNVAVFVSPKYLQQPDTANLINLNTGPWSVKPVDSYPNRVVPSGFSASTPVGTFLQLLDLSGILRTFTVVNATGGYLEFSEPIAQYIRKPATQYELWTAVSPALIDPKKFYDVAIAFQNTLAPGCSFTDVAFPTMKRAVFPKFDVVNPTDRRHILESADVVKAYSDAGFDVLDASFRAETIYDSFQTIERVGRRVVPLSSARLKDPYVQMEFTHEGRHMFHIRGLTFVCLKTG